MMKIQDSASWDRVDHEEDPEPHVEGVSILPSWPNNEGSIHSST